MRPRSHYRARIRLPVRLRWTTPFGQRIELCETVDVSRGGLLLSSREFHADGVPLWVTFPYDASLHDGQPEMLARVVRCRALPGAADARVADAREKVSEQMILAAAQQREEKSAAYVRDSGMSPAAPVCALALQFEAPAWASSNGNGARRDPERRESARRALAVPIRVRPENMPWFEEAMTLDFSSRGLRFRSQREYAAGDQLRIALEEAASTPWSGSGEFRALVVRVSPASDGVALDVSVCRAA